jgi:ATP-dependent RNA helicase DeaD
MLPTQGELRTRAEADMIAFLAEAYAGKAQDPSHLAIARRLLTYDGAEIVIAGLLADHLGASSARDPAQEAADARRAKNPPPVPQEAPPREDRRERGRSEREPRTLRDGEKPERYDDRGRGGDPRREGYRDQRGRDRGRREGPRTEDVSTRPTGKDEGERRERRPQSALSDWEPPAEKDDDAPLFREDGTKPGLGPPSPDAPRRDRAPTQPTQTSPLDARLETKGPRGRRRGRMSADEDAETIDIHHPPLPHYHIEDEPTVVFGGRLPKPRAPESNREPQPAPSSSEGASESGQREQDDVAFANVFLNVGRRDGLRPEDIQRLLVDRGGLTESDVGHIRLRDRITFVGIRKEHAERAMKAIIGVVVGDRTLNAEPARDR